MTIYRQGVDSTSLKRHVFLQMWVKHDIRLINVYFAQIWLAQEEIESCTQRPSVAN